VEIPFELRSDFQDVESLLEEKERNPDDVNVDFDDAIQIGGLCGGRDNGGWLNFTYHIGNAKRCTWDFRVHEFEIENYADGITRELQLYMCDSADCQCGSQDADFLCMHCDFSDDDPAEEHMNKIAPSIDSKEAFVAEFLRIEPDASVERIVRIFQPIPELGERVGWLAPSEVKAIMEKLKKP